MNGLSGRQIFLHHCLSRTAIGEAGAAYGYSRPRINANGWVVWKGHDGSDYEIYLYDGTSTTQLTDNGYDDSDPKINDDGWVVWIGCEGYEGDCRFPSIGPCCS